MKLRRRSISVDDDTWNKIAALANVLDRSTSDYVRIILKGHLKQLNDKPKEKEK